MPLIESFGEDSVRSFGAITGNVGIGSGGVLYTFAVGTYARFSTPLTGPTGPSLAQAISSLTSNAATTWSSNTSFFNQGSYNGYQKWTVPATGLYSIQTIGGGGSSGGGLSGGSGASMTGTFSLIAGQFLTILVGQVGLFNYGNGAGGGTYVALGDTASTATALIVAGGGAGGANIGGYNGNSANSNPNPGTTIGGTDGAGGSAGGSGGCGGGGGGFNYNANSAATPIAQGFTNGGVGGGYTPGQAAQFNSSGGFGGGGGGGNGSGGAGGYYGGNGGSNGTSVTGYPNYGSGGGGGSYNSGTNQTNTIASNANANGYVIITRLS